eukprot:CAMPEP_0182441514 /NCGR_PEP_ID=MMETSP1172-20130603/489_1 /TAXON_ID=708627 /ORGANISM="Timspurckia oligopyrenoides, Strain CCMP3278" /LENGTH=331 /DNA_ID=CAMNT_0024635857 /DNA_START=164 /DNA_END=1159 /DNA_ORIENTATION=-
MIKNGLKLHPLPHHTSTNNDTTTTKLDPIIIHSSIDHCTFVSSLDTISDHPQDFIFLAVKQHQLIPILDSLKPLIHSNSIIIPLQNGVPWWFFQSYTFQKSLQNTPLHSIDPHPHSLFHSFDPSQIVACVVYPAATIIAPGEIEHEDGWRLPVGDIVSRELLDSEIESNAKIVSNVLEDGGFKSFVLDEIRSEIWLKLWGSAVFNPVSALCHASLGTLCGWSGIETWMKLVMEEVQNVGEKVGCKMRVSLEKRLIGAAKVGDHKTSMLMDVEFGRKSELEPILGAVIEIAALTNTPVPRLDTLYNLMKLLEHVTQESSTDQTPFKVVLTKE